jgi:hypothetical protein
MAVLCGCASAPRINGNGQRVVTVPSGTLDGIVNTAVSGLTTRTDLARLQGHVALYIASGNRELDKKFAQAVEKAFPNFASRADTVRREDLYQMTVKIYRQDGDVVVVTSVSDFEQRDIVEQTSVIRGIQPGIVQTLQYRTATLAKNEFDASLDAAFAGTGAVVAEAQPLPPPPPPPPMELPAWIKPDIRFETAWWNMILPPGIGFSPKAFVLDMYIMALNWYMLFQFGVPFNKEEDTVSIFEGVGYLLRYNEYFYIPVEIGGVLIMTEQPGGSFKFSTGVMKLWKIGRWDFLDPVRVYTTVKLNLGIGSDNVLTNTLILSVGLVYDIYDRRIRTDAQEKK